MPMEDRNKDHLKSKWSEATVETAASFFTKSTVNMAGHAAGNRLMWDKAMSGANYFRYGICSWNDAICKFCVGKLETTSHKIAECNQPDCVELRDAALKEFEGKMLELSKTKLCRMVSAMRLYLTILKEEKSGLGWLGLWFGDQAIKIRRAIDSANLKVKEFRMLRNTVKKLSVEATKIVRKHDEAVVIKEIYDEQTPGLNSDELTMKVNLELGRGELQRRLRRRINVNKHRRWNSFEELGGKNFKKARNKVDLDEEVTSRDNNEHFMDILMRDPFEDGPKDDEGLLILERAGKRPEEWECWKKRKKKRAGVG